MQDRIRAFRASSMISGFVISHNRERLIETCLRSIRFVDELIVLDMSSTDGTKLVTVHQPIQ